MFRSREFYFKLKFVDFIVKFVDRIFVSFYSGLPAGVINMVFGTGKDAGSAIVEHPDVKLISFTGSTPVGKLIQEKSSAHVKKLSLEVSNFSTDVRREF